MSESGRIFTTLQGRTAIVEFSHPAGNSLPSPLLHQLKEQIDALDTNNDVSVIILQSSGNSFCGGAAFSELLSITDLEQGTRFFLGFANVINAIRTCSKLVVGRIHGKAVGGGVGLAAACDYTFATTQSAIKLSELSIGIGPFVIAPAVERKIGVSAMAQLTLNAEDWKSAEWALNNGLYSEVHESVEHLDAAIEKFTAKLASYNPEAVGAMKRALWTNTDHWGSLLPERAAISGRLVLSDFTKEALSKFKK